MAATRSSASSATRQAEKNSLLAGLPFYYLGTETMAPDQMRISFMGTTCIPMVSLAAVSVFVELGNGDLLFNSLVGPMLVHYGN